MPNPEDAALEPVDNVEAAFNFPFITATPNQLLTGTLTMRNTGTVNDWTSNTSPVYQRALNPETNPGWYSYPEQQTRWPLPYTPVLHNGVGVATFTVTVKAPPNPGQYFLKFQMVREIPGVQAVFFGDSRASRYPTVLVLPPAPTDKQNLVSIAILNTGTYLADGVTRKRRWLHTTGQALKVKKMYLWTGALRTTAADIGVYVRRISDGSPVQFMQWDHYAEPTAPNHGVVQDFGANYMTLLGNGADGLEIEYFSNPVLPPPPEGWHSQHVVVIWIEYP